MARSIIPVDVESKITGASPIFGEGVFGGNSSKEVISVGFGEVFYAKVINGKGEGCGESLVFPEARSVCNGVVTKGSQVIT